MSISDPKKIDAMADGGEILVLALSDHLRWDIEQAAHLSLLQEKMNNYIRFYESGEYMQHFNGKTFRKCRIEIFFLHKWHPAFDQMIDLVRDKLNEKNIVIKCILKENQVN